MSIEASLEERHLFSGGDLKFVDQLVDKGAVVGKSVPVEVVGTILVDPLGGGLDLVNMLVGLTFRADVIVFTDEEGHGDLLDLRHIDNGAVVRTILPVFNGDPLLESVCKTGLGPVLLVLRRAGLGFVTVGVVGANGAWVVLTNGSKITIPVWSSQSVDSNVLEVCDSLVEVELGPVGGSRNEARSHVDDLVDVVSVECALKLGKTVVNLDGALRVAHVEDFVDACGLLDVLDVRNVVVEAHISPGVIPIIIVQSSVQGYVTLRVLSATVVSDPDVIASIGQLQRPGEAAFEHGNH